MKQQRNTEQKKIIYNALTCADHPTASALYEKLHAEYPTISRATVFRVLSQFAESGKIRRVTIGGDDACYDAGTMPHAHLKCARCGKVCDYVAPDVGRILGKKTADGFKIYAADLVYVGVCEDCRNRTE